MKVTDKVYALDSTKGSYVYVIKDEEIVLIDSSFPGQTEKILRELKSLNINPQEVKHILLTHHDVDHIGNVAGLQKATGARVWISRADLPYMRGELKRHGVKKPLSSLFEIEMPENVFEYDESCKIGNIQVIPTPGHTPGHVSFIYEDILFTGDLVVNNRRGIITAPRFLTWNKDELRNSVKRVSQLSFNWVCPTHGSPIESNKLFANKRSR